MLSERLRQEIRDRDALARVLAEFLVWIDHPAFRSDDFRNYLDVCSDFIDRRMLVANTEWPMDSVAWCDWCGQQFSFRTAYRREPLTGESNLWCPDCLRAQTALFGVLGTREYRRQYRLEQQRAEQA